MWRRYRRLIENFGYLTALDSINLLLPLATYPYLIRILTPEVYGDVIYAQGIAAYHSVVVNFGFRISATKLVAEHRDDPGELSTLASSVLQAKLCLWCACLLIQAVLIASIPALSADPALFFLTFGATITFLLFPEWYFLGSEEMRSLTVITAGSRLASAVAIFTLIESRDDYLRLPMISFLAALTSSAIGLVALTRRGISLRPQPWARVRQCMKMSAPLFWSQAITSIADLGGTVAVGSVLGSAQLAYYNLAERIMHLASGLYLNLVRVLYPNLARSRDKAFSRITTRAILLAALLGTLTLAALAPFIVPIAGGAAMRPAVTALQLLSPYVFLAALGASLSNVLIYEGRARSILANAAVSTVFYVFSLGFLVATQKLTIESAALAFLASIVLRTAHRLQVLRRHGLTDWLHQPRDPARARSYATTTPSDRRSESVGNEKLDAS